jgi:Zn-dependent protease with chaperone function
MTQMPELYVSDKAISAPAQAFSAWKENYVVLGSTFLDAKLDEIQGVYEFLLGRELGHIRLGHTTWLDELLLAYVIRIPFLQNPIAMARTLSCDRYGAYLTKNCLRGLIVQSSGRRTLKLVNPEDYL